MVQIIAETRNDMTVVALKRGSLFYSDALVPDQIGHLVKINRIKTGKLLRLVTTTDVIMVVRGLWHDPCTGAKQILFMREDRSKENAGSLQFVGVHYYEDALRKILKEEGVRKIRTKGGLDRVLVYDDEIAVPEPSLEFEFQGWIIKKADAKKYLQKASLELEQPEKTKYLLIRHEIHARPGGQDSSTIRIEGWSRERSHKEQATLRSENIYQIAFNRTSRIVEGIFLTNKFVTSLSYDRSPIRSIVIGKPLPDNLGRGKGK